MCVFVLKIILLNTYHWFINIERKSNNTIIHAKQVEKEMETYSSVPAWKIPGMEEPGRLQSLGLDTTECLDFTSKFI